MHRLLRNVTVLLVLAVVLPAAATAAAAEEAGLTIRGSVFPQFWILVPKVEGTVVARLDRFEFPLDVRETAWEYQERVYLWMPTVHSREETVAVYKRALVNRGWPLAPPYGINNFANFGIANEWELSLVGITFPVLGGDPLHGYPIYSWKRTQSPNGYTVFLNTKVAKSHGFGVWIQVSPPLPPAFR